MNNKQLMPEMQNMESLFRTFCNDADDFIAKQKQKTINKI